MGEMSAARELVIGQSIPEISPHWLAAPRLSSAADLMLTHASFFILWYDSRDSERKISCWFSVGYQIYPLVTSLVGGSGDKDKELL